jgi:hypothetical protein
MSTVAEVPIHESQECPHCGSYIPHDPRRQHTKKDCHDIMVRRLTYATTQLYNLNQKKQAIEDDIAKQQADFTKWKNKMQEMGWSS